MYKRILFATDFDEVGMQALQKAKQLADENQAELHCVHVVEPMPAYAYPGFPGFTEVENTLKAHAAKELSDMATPYGVDDAHQHLSVGATKNEVLHVAKTIQADLIVCGSHGKHGWQLLLGSTANAILHGSECDVLVVRTAKDS